MKENRISQLTNRFLNNMYALRVFNLEIGKYAEEHDKLKMEQFSAAFANACGVDLADFEVTAQYTEMAEKEDKNKGKDSNIETDVSDKQDSQTIDQIRRALSNPDNAELFYKSFKDLRRTSPVQTAILRQGTLLNLMIFYETLITDLIHAYYDFFPSALPSKERVLSLAELREIGSIEEAEKYLVEQEASNVLRSGTKEQLDYLKGKTKVDLSPLANYLDNLIEISLRRNVIVHNKGIANKIYISQVSKRLLEENGIEIGFPLPIEDGYLVASIDTVCLCGIILIQQCWRKWKKEEILTADGMLADFTYDTLTENRYELTVALSTYANGIKFSQERSKRVTVINQAIALKRLGNIKEMESVLSTCDWSACSIEFQVALHALRMEEERLFDNLANAILAGNITKSDLLEWPLFAEYRDTPKFRELVEKHFPPDDESGGKRIQ